MSLIPDEHRILVNDENASQTNKVAVKANQGGGFSVYERDDMYSENLSNIEQVSDGPASYLTFPTDNTAYCYYDVSVGRWIYVWGTGNNVTTSINSSWLTKRDNEKDDFDFGKRPWLENKKKDGSGWYTNGFLCAECVACYDECNGCFNSCVECTTGCTSSCTAGCTSSCTNSCQTECTGRCYGQSVTGCVEYSAPCDNCNGVCASSCTTACQIVTSGCADCNNDVV